MADDDGVVVTLGDGAVVGVVEGHLAADGDEGAFGACGLGSCSQGLLYITGDVAEGGVYGGASGVGGVIGPSRHDRAGSGALIRTSLHVRRGSTSCHPLYFSCDRHIHHTTHYFHFDRFGHHF